MEQWGGQSAECGGGGEGGVGGEGGEAVWAEGVWAHIGSLYKYFIKTYTTRTKGRRR